MRFLLFLVQLLDRVVVLVDMLDHDVAHVLDLQVPVYLHVVQHTVAVDYQRRARVHPQFLDLMLQFLCRTRLTLRQVAKNGEIDTSGKNANSEPATTSGLSSLMSAPQSLRRWRLLMQMSASQWGAPSPLRPCWCFRVAEARSFLRAEKQQPLGTLAKPTLSQLWSSLGQSCIMHSSLAEDLNLVLVASAYLGLMNSLIRPWVRSSTSTQVDSLSAKQLVFPGSWLYPSGYTGSPPTSLNAASTWLYSMFIVSSLLVSFSTRLVIAPTASPGFRGTPKVLKSQSLAAEIPSKSGKLLRAKGFVSWKTAIHFLPSACHFLAKPLMCKRV